MQSLEVISLNIWQILISLCNLLLLSLLLKRFLYKPVKKVLAERQKMLDEQYAAAREAETSANRDREEWQAKMQEVQTEADRILKKATTAADRRSEQILLNAKNKADDLQRQAELQIQLERRKAEAEVKKEIADISTELAAKMIGREMTPEDHRNMIDSFLQQLDDSKDTSEKRKS